MPVHNLEAIVNPTIVTPTIELLIQLGQFFLTSALLILAGLTKGSPQKKI